MLKRLYRLIFVLIILSLALWIVLLNRDNVTVNLGNNQTYAAPLGAMIIFIFSAGVLCTSFVASLFGFRAYLRERGFLAQDRRRAEFSADCAKGRSLTIAAQYPAARRLWENLVKRDPNDVQARLWLARTLEEEGDPVEALRIVDAARSTFPGDCEILFRAAELNKKLGNKTAAIDNLALLISHQPSEKAAREARNLSVELNRLADALEYNSQLERLGADRKELREFEAQVRFAQIRSGSHIKSESGESDSGYITQLRELVSDFPESSAALIAIAEIEKNEGNFETASQALVKAAGIDQSIAAWGKAIDLWVSQKQPERAISVARLAIKEADSNRRAEFEIMLARLYLQFGMYSDGKILLESLQKNYPDAALQQQITPLLARCLIASGHEREAAELWKKVA